MEKERENIACFYLRAQTITYKVTIWEDNVEDEVEKRRGEDYGEGS